MTQDYIRHFGKPQTELKHIFSPYRVCPIGAHVDHQHASASARMPYAPIRDTLQE